MLVRGVERENHIWAELLEVTFAIWTAAVGVDHATHCDEIAWLVISNGRPDFCYTANDLMARDDRIIRRHELAPFVAHRMKIGVADATEQDFNLHVAVSRIATLDFR